MLLEDVRLEEGLKACMNCGVCTAVCPAAEFYNYDPRQIVAIVQSRDDEQIEYISSWLRYIHSHTAPCSGCISGSMLRGVMQ